jgi:putative Holliday junction resolvase
LNNLLAIDYGERYLGLAVRTTKTSIPIPVDVIDKKKTDPQKQIDTFIENYSINKIIVGYPIGMNNAKNRMTDLVDEFINYLQKYNISIHKVDERFSSDIYETNGKERIDDLSALQLLETYIRTNEK